MVMQRIDDSIIANIEELRHKGWSYERIAEALNISTSTAKKYAPFGVATHLPRNAADKTRFTDRQIEIAIAAMKKIEQEGKKSWVRKK